MSTYVGYKKSTHPGVLSVCIHDKTSSLPDQSHRSDWAEYEQPRGGSAASGAEAQEKVPAGHGEALLLSPIFNIVLQLDNRLADFIGWSFFKKKNHQKWIWFFFKLHPNKISNMSAQRDIFFFSFFILSLIGPSQTFCLLKRICSDLSLTPVVQNEPFTFFPQHHSFIPPCGSFVVFYLRNVICFHILWLTPMSCRA